MELRDYINEANKIRRNAAEDDLIGRYILLPISVATKMMQTQNLRGHNIQTLREDLISAGNVALCEAVDTFDPDKGHFGAYAKMLVNQRIRRELDRWRTGGRIRDFRALHAVQNAAAERRRAEQSVTPETIAEDVGLPVARVRALLNLAGNTTRLDEPVKDDPETTHATHLIDAEADVEGKALQAVVAEERKELKRAVETLSPHARAAIGITTGYKAFDTVTLGDLLRAHGAGVQSTARLQIRQRFQRRRADAGKLGYEPEEATGPDRHSGRLRTPSSDAGNGHKQIRNNASNIWRRVASRWREAPGVDAS